MSQLLSRFIPTLHWSTVLAWRASRTSFLPTSSLPQQEFSTSFSYGSWHIYTLYSPGVCQKLLMPGPALEDGDSFVLGMASTFQVYERCFSGSNIQISLGITDVDCIDLQCQNHPCSPINLTSSDISSTPPHCIVLSLFVHFFSSVYSCVLEPESESFPFPVLKIQYAIWCLVIGFWIEGIKNTNTAISTNRFIHFWLRNR